jgi:glycosyltransferase involved in cell wall biosynthesis
MFTDFIPTSEVKYYFSSADCVILPYRDATQSGIVQIATNFSKPVIAANVGGIGEVIENNKTGFIVEKENPEALAEAIQKFYLESRETEFVKNIAVEVKKYSWESFVSGIFELLNQTA